MPEWLKAALYVLGGCSIITAGVLFWRRADRVVASIRRTGTALFGEKAADTVYTAWNAKWAFGGWIVMGTIMVVSGVAQFLRLG